MNKIAQLAQVSKRTVYNHFESKQALIMYLLSDVWNNAAVQIDIKYNSETALDVQLYALLIAEVEALSSPSFIDLARVAMEYFLFQPDSLQQELCRYDDTATALYKWLQDATDNQRLNIDDIDYTYTLLHGMLKGSCFWPQLTQYAAPLDAEQKQRLVTDTVTMFLALYS